MKCQKLNARNAMAKVRFHAHWNMGSLNTLRAVLSVVEIEVFASFALSVKAKAKLKNGNLKQNLLTRL